MGLHAKSGVSFTSDDQSGDNISDKSGKSSTSIEHKTKNRSTDPFSAKNSQSSLMNTDDGQMDPMRNTTTCELFNDPSIGISKPSISLTPESLKFCGNEDKIVEKYNDDMRCIKLIEEAKHLNKKAKLENSVVPCSSHFGYLRVEEKSSERILEVEDNSTLMVFDKNLSGIDHNSHENTKHLSSGNSRSTKDEVCDDRQSDAINCNISTFEGVFKGKDEINVLDIPKNFKNEGDKKNINLGNIRDHQDSVFYYSYPMSKSDITKKMMQKLQHPARKQVDFNETRNYAYTEGNDEYNIWYGRYLNDRDEKNWRNRDPNPYKCDPEKDCGYTQADMIKGSDQPYLCVYFSRGCCFMGEECSYRHRLPIEEDEFMIDASRDIFGRERYARHRDDMGGVGSFNSECKSLFIGGLRLDRSIPNGMEKLENFVRQEFGKWGEIENLRCIPKKNIAFVTYKYRVYAEFAKEAMEDQNVGEFGSILSVRWANAQRNKSINDHAQSNVSKPLIQMSNSKPGSVIDYASHQNISFESSKDPDADVSWATSAWKSLYSTSQPFVNSSTSEAPGFQSLVDKDNCYDHFASYYSSSITYGKNESCHQAISEANILKPTENNMANNVVTIGPSTKEEVEEAAHKEMTEGNISKMRALLSRIDAINSAVDP